MSQLDLGTQSLELERFPPQENSNTLQAWEAADEYLLQNIDLSKIDGRPVLVFNDQLVRWPALYTLIARSVPVTLI